MSNSARDLRAALHEAWTPRPNVKLSDLAEQHMHLTGGKEQGLIRFERTPYSREPLDRLHPDDPVQVVVLEWGIQLAKTTVGLAWTHGVMGAYPGPMLTVFDKWDKAAEYSKQRLEPMIRHSEICRDKVVDQRTRSKDSSTIKVKMFPGGMVKVAGAQSASDLISTPIQYANVDEVDAHAENVSRMGSSVQLVMGRLTTYGDTSKALLVSSPTVEGASEIHSWFQRGDQRYFFVPCVHCGEMQRLEWRDPETGEFRLQWESGHPETAMYFCPFCGAGMQDADKNKFLPAGEWRASRPDLGENGTITSYHLNGLYSPHGMYSWEKMARQWMQANERAKAGDVEELKVFVNTRLAQVFSQPGDLVPASTLAKRVEPSWGDTIPDGVKAIVVGGDVQDDRVELMVAGVGAGREWWLLDYFIIPSDPLDDETWRQVDQVLRRTYIRDDGTVLRPRAGALDSGFRTQKVYEFCNRRRRVYATKGVPGKGKAIWPRKARKSTRYKQSFRFFDVGVDTAKDAAQSYLRIHREGPGYVHIPDHILSKVPDFLDQLSSEKRIRTKDSKGRQQWVWQKVTEAARNEAWDTFVLCIAASHALSMGGLDLRAPAPAAPKDVPDLPPPPSPQPPSRGALPSRREGKRPSRPPRRGAAPRRPERGRTGWG